MSKCKNKRDHVLTLVKSKCEGKVSCELKADVQIIYDSCLETIKYIEVQYYCKIKGEIPEYNCVLLLCLHKIYDNA